ncbi:MAG: branched-chain amino acid ABC transporter permease [Armatimonadota bacterium]|nr:branched-chain amino acid ABC transporter permease [Armatimonadota bacterium]
MTALLDLMFGPYALTLLILVSVNTTLAASLNLITGYAGQVSIGHAAFYAIGAYAAGLLFKTFGWGFWLTLPSAALMSFAAGLVIGAPSLRVEHDFLAIVTLGLGLVVQGLALNLEFTGGPYGIAGVPRISAFGREFGLWGYAATGVALAAVTLLVVYRITRARPGTALMAVREDPLAAEVIGINTSRYKILAFATGALFAGAAGSLYAHYATFVGHDSFGLGTSIAIMSMVVVGGLGRLWGPVVGAVLLTLIPELIRFTAAYRMFLYGLLLVVTMRYMPQGLLGALAQRKPR